MKIVVSSEHDQQRLDVVLVEYLESLSRSSVRKLIDDHKVTINGSIEKAGFKLHTNDVVIVDYNPENQTIPTIDLPILYEDEDCLVINKPTGVLTHSKGAFNPEATVATFIASMISSDWQGDRAGIVHRLDRATSGVIICAKTPEALSALQKQFSQRNAKKTYYAVVEGTLDPPEAVIEVPIERNVRDPKTFRPSNSGKPATTTYHVESTGNGYSLLKLEPQTGRTHQLRVHLKYIDHPIVGDPIYGGAPHSRMLLHAEKLELTLPNRQRKVFEAPLPSDFRDILKA